MIKLGLLAKIHLQEHVETGLRYYESELERFNQTTKQYHSSQTAHILETQITTKIEVMQ